MNDDLQARLEKKNSGNFTYQDLSDNVQAIVPENTPVAALPVDKWVKLGKLWILCKETGGWIEYDSIKVITRPNRTLLNWILLPIARIFIEGKWVFQGDIVPGTDVIFDVWYARDGSEDSVVLAVTTS